MIADKILAKLTQLTAWISNIAVVAKPNKVRICLDLLHRNKAVKRNHYPIPTIHSGANPDCI